MFRAVDIGGQGHVADAVENFVEVCGRRKAEGAFAERGGVVAIKPDQRGTLRRDRGR